jgi:hypothetical protein
VPNSGGKLSPRVLANGDAEGIILGGLLGGPHPSRMCVWGGGSCCEGTCANKKHETCPRANHRSLYSWADAQYCATVKEDRESRQQGGCEEMGKVHGQGG